MAGMRDKNQTLNWVAAGGTAYCADVQKSLQISVLLPYKAIQTQLAAIGDVVQDRRPSKLDQFRPISGRGPTLQGLVEYLESG